MSTSYTRDADVAQAAAFIVALNDHIDACTEQIERLGDDSSDSSRSAADLRSELYGIHRQIDRLRVAFPELRNAAGTR